MSVIFRIIRIDHGTPQLLIQRRGVVPMIDKGRAGGCRGVAGKGGEAIRGPGVLAAFPDVVGRGGADNDGSALGLEELRGVDEVGVESEDVFVGVTVCVMG